MRYFVISNPFKVIFTNVLAKKQKLRNSVFGEANLFFSKKQIFVRPVMNLLLSYGMPEHFPDHRFMCLGDFKPPLRSFREGVYDRVRVGAHDLQPTCNPKKKLDIFLN